MPKSLTESIQTITGMIATFTAFLAVLEKFSKTFDTLHKQLENSTWNLAFWTLTAVLLVVGLLLLRKGLSRKSRLLWPEALLIDPDNPDHLRGRQVEIKRLENAVAANPLVFLEGESGAGKSALIRSGLIPALSGSDDDAGPASAIVPIYINSYGADWDRGVEEQLIDATWRWLGDERRETLGITTRNSLARRLLSAGAKTGLFPCLRNKLGLIPLLIFDQFDDYQVTHRSRFLSNGRWIAADELTEDSKLWKRIQALLDQRLLHIMVVTRRDLTPGLEAVRFERPETYALDRVEPVYITALLEQLTSTSADKREVIADPEDGWEQLKSRLIQDLSAQGRILPIQARVVFHGLTELPYLNVAAYERAGGIEGLEAAYIEDAVSAATRAAKVSEAQVFAVLLKLVDDSDPKLPKAKSAAASALDEAAGSAPDQLECMLTVLKREGVVRPDAAKNGDASWSLYHDYLARAVLSAQRRSDRWQQMLKDRLRAFNEAVDWRTRWQALLSPWEQILLIWPTLRGKVRWAGYHGIAVASSLRHLPMIAVLSLFLVGGDRALGLQAQYQVTPILSGIRSAAENDVPGREAYSQLWSLAAANPRVKRAFIKRSITITDKTTRGALIKHFDAVTQSIFGLDHDARLRKWALDQALGADVDGTYRVLLIMQTWQSAPTIFAGTEKPIADAVIKTMAKTKNWEELSGLGEALGHLGDKLTVDQAAAAAKHLVEAMANTKNWDEFSDIGEPSGDLGNKLPAELVAAVAKQVLEAMANTKDWHQLRSLGEALGNLGDKLPVDQIAAAAKYLVEAMANTKNWIQLNGLGKALGSLGDKLPADQAAAAAKYLVEAMANTKDQHQLRSLGEALSSLGDKLPADQAAAAAKYLVEAMANTKGQFQLNSFGEALGWLGDKLLADQTAAVAKNLVEAMANTKDQHQLISLGRALVHLGDKLPADQAAAAAKYLVEAMANTKNQHRLRSLGEALGRLGDKLLADQTAAVAKNLVEAMANTKDQHQLISFGRALVRLGDKLPADQAAAAAKYLVEAMANSKNQFQLNSLGEALGRLGDKLLVDQTAAVAKNLVEAMANTKDQHQLISLGRALVRLGDKLPADQAAAAAKHLVEAMANTTNRIQLNGLGKASGHLGDKMTADQAPAAKYLVEAIASTEDQHQLISLGEALGSLGNKLPADQAAAAAKHLLEAMAKTNDWRPIGSLGEALGALGNNVPEDQAVAAARHLVETMANTKDWDGLSSLGEALGRLGDKLPTDRAAAVAKQLLEAMANTKDQHQLIGLGKALVRLGDNLLADQAAAVAKQLVEVMANTKDWFELNSLGKSLGALGNKLPVEQATAAAKHVLEVMAKTRYSDELSRLAEVLRSLGDKLSADQAAAAAELLLAAMAKTKDMLEFSNLAEVLALTQLAPNPAAIKTASNFLQAPGAFGDTRKHLLTYYGRLAGRDFSTYGNVIAWSRINGFDLTHPPHNPFH